MATIAERITGFVRQPTADLTEQELAELLSSERRRRVIRILEDRATITLGDLAELVAAAENDISRHAVRSDQRKRTYTALYQVHLPKLDKWGIVDFEKRGGVVRPTADVPAVVDVADELREVAGA